MSSRSTTIGQRPSWAAIAMLISSCLLRGPSFLISAGVGGDFC